MQRRGFLAGAVVTALSGCTGGGGGFEFSGPTEEDPDEVDVQYRAFTPDEVESIRSGAMEVDYDGVLADVESHEGDSIVFGGPIVEVLEFDDHRVFRISMAGDPTQIQYVYASWTGDEFGEGDLVTCWGVVLGRETYKANMGREETALAVAIADMERREE